MLPNLTLATGRTLKEVQDGQYVIPGTDLNDVLTTVRVIPGRKVRQGTYSRFKLQFTYRRDLSLMMDGAELKRDAVSIATTIMLPDYLTISDVQTAVAECEALLSSGNLEHIFLGGS